MVNVAMKQWLPISAGRTAALHLCVAQQLPLVSLICGILPKYCEFNEMESTQSVGWNGVFCCPRSPSRPKGIERTAEEVQGGVALVAVLFASIASARVFVTWLCCQVYLP